VEDNINRLFIYLLNMSTYAIFRNGEEIKNKINLNYPFLWYGHFSVAKYNGTIVHFIIDYLKKINKSTIFALFQDDGNIPLNYIVDATENIITPNDNLIVGTLAQITEDKDIHYLYLPLDDVFFENGVSRYFQNIPSWNERKAIAYWRGGCSGDGGINSIRCRVVGKLLDYDKADAKITHWGGWENGKNVPENYFGDRMDYTEFLKYKIFMIVDGNCIASNHMWGFASGGVPFIISNAKCWFSEFLIPFVNYIPIQYDLSDLKEKIEWVVHNDSEAEKIAQNALQFSREVFSSEFQKKYVMNKINQFVGI
jgi:glycosyltransferase involved in cell wall biosynthesis